MNGNFFDQIDWGDLTKYLNDDDVTDVSYSNGGQVWLKTLSKGVYRVEEPTINNALMEKIAFQCANCMGKTFNMASPFLDAESSELRLNFVHDSIATNGIACVIRKTPAKIRLNKEKLISDDYVSEALHDFLFRCVEGHCNILVSGETGSGKTELVKYLAAHTRNDEKIISIEDTLELHLDRIFPHRDIVAMKTNNIASYSDVLVACMRENPKWILLSEVRSAEAVTAVRNSISSGHNIISTIHSDKASAIPMRLYSLLESSQDIEQFVKSMHRYIQIGIHVKGYLSRKLGRFQREIIEVCEFYVDDETNEAKVNVLYKKGLDGTIRYNNPTPHLMEYLAMAGVEIPENCFVDEDGNFNPKRIAASDVLGDDKPADGEMTKAPSNEKTNDKNEQPQITIDNKNVVESKVVQQNNAVPLQIVNDENKTINASNNPSQVVPNAAPQFEEKKKINMEDLKTSIDMGSIVSQNGFEIVSDKPQVTEPQSSIQVVGVNEKSNLVGVPKVTKENIVNMSGVVVPKPISSEPVSITPIPVEQIPINPSVSVENVNPSQSVQVIGNTNQALGGNTQNPNVNSGVTVITPKGQEHISAIPIDQNIVNNNVQNNGVVDISSATNDN